MGESGEMVHITKVLNKSSVLTAIKMLRVHVVVVIDRLDDLWMAAGVVFII